MRSNNSDVVVVNVVDCGSGGGESAQLRPDQCGGRIGQWRGSGARAVGRCGRGVLARRDDDGGVGDGGSGAVWGASAGDDQTESFDLLTS
jgi:hypothetical protein